MLTINIIENETKPGQGSTQSYIGIKHVSFCYINATGSLRLALWKFTEVHRRCRCPVHIMCGAFSFTKP